MLVRFSVSTGSGVEIYFYEIDNYKRLMLEPQLLSGLMTAIQMYSESVGQTIQYIQFSNLILYLQSYGDFTLRLLMDQMMDTKIIEYYFNQIAKETVLILPCLTDDFTYNEKIFEKKILPILKPLIQDPFEENEFYTHKKSIRKSVSSIALVGLANAGKTSIINLFFENLTHEQAKITRPTIGLNISQKFLDFLKHSIAIMDFGGQDHYRQEYLDQKETWENISAIIYVVDVQDVDSFKPASDYLKKIWELVTSANERAPRLSILIHKYDPIKREALRENLKNFFNYFKDFIETAIFHLTTIEDSSTKIALVKSLYFSLPNVMLSRLLEEEFLDHFEASVWPQFSRLVDHEQFQEEEMRMKIHQSAVILGMNQGFWLQESWMNYLMGEWTPKPRLLKSKSLEIQQKGKELNVTISDTSEGQDKELTIILLDGMLTGILKTFHLLAPKIIEREGVFTTWEVLL